MRLRINLYEGPGSHGALRAASGMKGVRSLLRALPSETYFEAFFTSLERSGKAPPVTLSPLTEDRKGRYTPGDLVRDLTRAVTRHPDTETVVHVRSDAALLADGKLPEITLPKNPQTGRRINLVTCEGISPRTGELAAVDLTVEELVRSHARPLEKTQEPTVNIFGPPALNPRAAAEYAEAERLLRLLGVGINARVPLGGGVHELSRISRAWANLVLYREAGESATLYLQDEFDMPRVTTPMIGAAGTGAVLRSIGKLCGLETDQVQRVIWGQLGHTSRLPWFTRLITPESLQGRRTAIFGDLTYALGLGYALSREVGMNIAWTGTYLEHLERDFLFHASSFTDDAFFTDDPEEVADRVESSETDLLIGTHLEEEIAEALSIPFLPLCPPAINIPFVEKPLMGYKGSSFLADALDVALKHKTRRSEALTLSLPWTEEALEELDEVPAFLRGRAQRLAEEHARDTGAQEITREVFERSRT